MKVKKNTELQYRVGVGLFLGICNKQETYTMYCEIILSM